MAYNVAGKGIKDIMNIPLQEFNKLNESDLRKVVGRLVSAGNKRLRSFTNTGESSPATRYIERSGGAFTVRGKGLNELRAEFARAKNFLESKTSTKKGYNAVKRDIVQQFKKRGVANVNIKNVDRMLSLYEKLKEVDPSVSNKTFKYKVMEELSEEIETDESDESIIERMTDELSEIYENETELLNNGVSDFFEI